MKKAPIAFFAYKRPDHTLRSLISLAENEGAKDSELFIFCDGAKKTADQDAVNQVREIVRSQQWCGTVNIVERQSNIGLANSIISGVTELCQKYGRVIVLEDDLVLSPFFLDYMNTALDLYANNHRVMQISGYMFPVNLEVDTDAVFLPFTTSWGWATWQRAWNYFDPHILGYERLKSNKGLIHTFNLNGSYPYFEMLLAQINGKIDSWAIRWYLNTFMLGGMTLHPVFSLVKNIGFDGSGTHYQSTEYKELGNEISTSKILYFPNLVAENQKAKNIIFNYLGFGENQQIALIKPLLKMKYIFFKIKFNCFDSINNFAYKIAKKIITWKQNIDNKLIASKIKHGENCYFSHEAKVFNHPNKSELITLGDGVYIDGVLEVYDRGNLFIDNYTFFGKSRIFCTVKILIGKGCWIADNVFIMDSNLHPISPKRRFQDAVDFSKGIFPDVYSGIPNAPVIINDYVWIGVGSVILKGVTIGEGAVVGAGSVVTKNVPPWTIVAGNPARIIREIPENER